MSDAVARDLGPAGRDRQRALRVGSGKFDQVLVMVRAADGRATKVEQVKSVGHEVVIPYDVGEATPAGQGPRRGLDPAGEAVGTAGRGGGHAGPRTRSRLTKHLGEKSVERHVASLSKFLTSEGGRPPSSSTEGRPYCAAAPEAYGFTAPILAQTFFPSGKRPLHSQTFAVFAVAFALRPVGGASFGTLGDRIGGKRVLLLTV